MNLTRVIPAEERAKSPYLPKGVRFFCFFDMKLTVNGEELVTAAITLKELIQELRLQPEGVAAEVNLSVIRRKDFQSFMLKEGDTVELVNFVGGG